LLAGGIGVTPILAMARQLQADGADFRLHFCARAEVDAPFLEHLRVSFGSRLIAHFDGGERLRSLDLGKTLSQRAHGEHVYVCGPAGMIEAARKAAAHWPAGTVHFELFQAQRPPPDAAADTGFNVVLAKSKVTLEVPAGKSILSVLLAYGMTVDSACESGICGICTVGVLSGKVEHRDSVLSDEQKASNTLMQVCVSRPLPGERLVLDL
jgi:vanillate O-demethylase ferredoxin subunit